ncbi:putative DNA-binding transcriptional regulator AlpA [Arthrobacter pascens]|uniref:helix-turn-helix transcriptional regulator n=1 Tax=Arthrobacter pascens TaxID=1677 RepID=UPI00278FB671|nr:helix-turn-helix domain-containing protein [Arthrobacter pascens]MDQ0679062.1 putative DNA-binding transcriptional regulator AlpA [Arthrobacter pascens]
MALLIATLLTLGETAERLRKSEAQLRWMIHVGTAPRSAKIGGRRLFKASDVENYINAAFDDEASQ